MSLRLLASGFAAFATCTCLPQVGSPPQKVSSQVKPDAGQRLEKAPQSAGAQVTGPRLRILGTAQDGGLPHAACTCSNCLAARTDPDRASYIASLAVLLPERTLLVDATPDVRAQLDLLADVRGRGTVRGRVDRHPVDGVLLTHAHIGHYLGLAFFGFEAIHSRDIPVYATPELLAFLGRHAPWEQLVQTGNLKPETLAPGSTLALGSDVTVTPMLVPHRDEYANTVAFRFDGPRSRVLYLPDTDPWSRWSSDPLALVSDIDVALVDGTFYSSEELPGRDLAKIGHPLITDSMALFGPQVHDGTLAVYFIHLNHSNPALDPRSPAARSIREAGFQVARTGFELPL